MIKVFVYILIFGLSYFGVEMFRRWSISNNILDVPNQRSSHQIPTPRGGGLIIVLVTLISISTYQIFYGQTLIWSYLIGAVLIALVSWLDDVYTLSVVWRFLCHFTAAALIVIQFGYLQTIYIPLINEVNIGMLGLIFTTLWIVWFTNAYNFMDGIDGLAGIQAITASIGWFLVGWFWSIDLYVLFGIVLFLTNLAFLLHNWQPAKVFMGDVGSAFLGYTFAVLPLISITQIKEAQNRNGLFIIGLLFIWLFVFDTLITFLKRIFKVEKVWKAHRQHMYQIMIKNNFAHSTVSILYGTLSIILVVATFYCMILNKFEVILISITLFITITLVLIVYNKKLLT